MKNTRDFLRNTLLAMHFVHYINEFNKLNQDLKIYEKEVQEYQSNLNLCTITLFLCDENLEKFKENINILLKNPSLKGYAKNKVFVNLMKKNRR